MRTSPLSKIFLTKLVKTNQYFSACVYCLFSWLINAGTNLSYATGVGLGFFDNEAEFDQADKEEMPNNM